MDPWNNPTFWRWAESLQELVLVLSPSGIITGCHYPEQANFPLPPEEVQGRHFREALPGGGGEALEAALGRLLETGAPQRADFRLEVNGRQLHYEARIGALVEDGRQVGVLTVLSETTEQALARQALLESEAFYRLLAENASDVVTVKRLDGGYVYASPSVEAMLGVSPEEILGKRIEDLWQPEDLACGQAAAELVPPPEGVLVQRRVRHRDGRWIWVESDARLVDWKGSPAVLCNTRDISRRRTAEECATAMLEEIKASGARAEAASEAKSEFLAGMSHSLRTPLHGILGMAELLAGTHLSEEQRQYLAAIEDSGKVLLGMLADLQDLSKIEAGELDLQHVPFDLVENVEGLSDIVGRQIGARGNDLRCQVAAGVPTLVRGDPSRLRQVLINLLSAARKHTENGEISVEAKLTAQARIRFRVESGGMLARRGELSRTIEHDPQRDLGLALARSLVELMGGELSATISDRGRSAVDFELELPAAAPDELFSVGQDLRGVRVLLGDGDAASRQALREIREGAGAEVEVGSGGVEVIRTLQASDAPFQCLVLDASLPDIEGASVAALLHSDTRFAVLPIILHASAEFIPSLQGRESEVVVLVAKPVRSDLLIRAVLDSIRGSHSVETKPRPGGSVLVVEDNDVNLRIAHDLLRLAGYQVLAARSGAEALTQLERVSVDAVLMDIQLPDMDGLEATSLIRQRPGLQQIPIIAMTAHAMKGDAERFLRGGLDNYLSKPVDRRELLEVLSREIAKRRGAPAAERR